MTEGRPLPRGFYCRHTLDVARDLLGQILQVRSPDGMAQAFIVEVEAYLGARDPASHAYGRITPRNRVMYETPGHAYVYFIYGNHYCVNAVAHDEAEGSGAVLLRAVQPWKGVDLMRARRGLVPGSRHLTNGPGKLTEALGIGPEHNRTDLLEGPVRILHSRHLEPFEAVASPRVGIRKAAELPYRFHIAGNPFVSKTA